MRTEPRGEAKVSFRRLLTQRFEAAGLPLSPRQVEQLVTYAQELKAWNRRFNLTRITDDAAIIEKHFLDSLCALPFLPAEGRAMDVGTGAGFPGIPLAIYHEGLEWVLVESRGKKVRFLNHVVHRLGLNSVEVIGARAEALSQEPSHHEAYDRVLTRYVASLRKSVPYCLALTRPGGFFIAYKGSDVESELTLARRTVQKYGGVVREIRRIATHRTLVIIQKESTYGA